MLFHQLTTKVLDGIFLGYCQMSGGNWNGDLYVIDKEELADADTPDEVTVKRFKASEVHIDKPEGNFYFPVAEGDWTQPNRDEHLRAVQEKKRARKEKAEREKLITRQRTWDSCRAIRLSRRGRLRTGFDGRRASCER